jgi:anti-sigma regulatory factor (Ser/Thr protein kinase)
VEIVSMLTFAVDDARCLPGLRAWIRDHVSDQQVCGDAELVCTELVSNAIDHAIGPRAVRIDVTDGGAVLIEVDDGSGEAEMTPGRSRLGTNRGRGLDLVEAFSRWGVRQHPHDGKTVWAALAAA